MAEGTATFRANLAALARTEPELAQRLREAEPAVATFAPSKAGPLTAVLEQDGKSLSLASRYDPLAEAKKLIEGVDHSKAPCVIVLGLGLGYHVQELARDMQGRGVLIVYEPDLAVLRAVLEQVDHTGWLGRPNVILGDAQMDRAGLAKRVEKLAAMLTQGTQLVVHPPSRQRHAAAFAEFGKAVTETLAFCRTSVATALVNSARTCRNLACNLAPYAAGATTDELHQAAKGYPAICVSAGPSLAKNVELLQDPAVRQNVVVIAVQTALKPLLDRGIRPDFVTALDYSQICRQFYEDLPELPDVTLVVEPKAHPTIIEHFPGPIRVTYSNFNDELLAHMARPIIPMRSGATVAHLSFYLAQHLGCDPIIFIGQDLGFSNGLYYAPGTAVHRVWASELNAFNTVEMMEWQRVVRHKGHLRRMDDVDGQPIFSDEQMITYLKQFERDFMGAPQKIIDATEGGLPKQHTTRMTLAEAVEQHATRPVPAIAVPPRELDRDRLEALLDLMHTRLREVNELRNTSKRTIPILRQMQEHQRDNARMQTLFTRLKKLQSQVHTELQAAFTLVNALNTVGAFKRSKTDHAISYLKGDVYERQTQQLERDIENLDWLIQACDEAMEIFREARGRVEEALKQQPRRQATSVTQG